MPEPPAKAPRQEPSLALQACRELLTSALSTRRRRPGLPAGAMLAETAGMECPDASGRPGRNRDSETAGALHAHSTREHGTRSRGLAIGPAASAAETRGRPIRSDRLASI